MAYGIFKGIVTGGVTGYIQDVTADETIKTTEGENSNGITIFYNDYDRQADLTFNVLTGATAAPATGATFTATSATQLTTGGNGGAAVQVSGNTRFTGTYAIRGVTITESNKDCRKLSIKGHRYISGGLP